MVTLARETVSTPSSQGIYDVPEAARYLRATSYARELYPVSSRKLIGWIRRGLASPELSDVAGTELLIEFEDLVSMRVIAALRALHQGHSHTDQDNRRHDRSRGLSPLGSAGLRNILGGSAGRA